MWRLARIFDEAAVPVTVSAAAVALELNPAVPHWMRERDHDLLGHGWRWIPLWDMPRDEEREHLRRAVASYEQTLGQRPIGWNCPSWPSESTRELLVEEGGFLYDSDGCADDVPYYASCQGKPFLVVPYSKTYNDSRFLMNPGFASPRDFLDTLVMGLDELVRDDRTTMMTVAVHARWSGQAARAAALRAFLEHARRRPASRSCGAVTSPAGGSSSTRPARLNRGNSGDRLKPVTVLGSAEKLVRVGHRHATHDAVLVGLVVPHPPERRRVDVDRGRRHVGLVAHPVDVGRVEIE